MVHKRQYFACKKVPKALSLSKCVFLAKTFHVGERSMVLQHSISQLSGGGGGDKSTHNEDK